MLIKNKTKSVIRQKRLQFRNSTSTPLTGNLYFEGFNGNEYISITAGYRNQKVPATIVNMLQVNNNRKHRKYKQFRIKLMTEKSTSLIVVAHICIK